MSVGRHLVVGAGFAGLGVAAAFERAGVPYEVVEADDDVGGNWYHGVYDTAHIISSRKTTEYADYPMPSDWPDFPSAAQMLAYLRQYAVDAGVRPKIRFGQRVTAVRPSNGAWEVTVVGAEGARSASFAGVVVCNGHHWDRRWPEVPGLRDGVRVIHGKDYKSASMLAGQRVLVIGGGNTACDIAVEASRVGVSSEISLRRGYWFMPKTALGVPTVELLRPWMGPTAQRALTRFVVAIVVGDYRRYGLPLPDHRPFDKHPTINTELLHGLRHGRIVARPDVVRFEGSTAVYADGARSEVDLVVCATGYHASVPFFADGLLPVRDGVPQLVGGCFVPGQRGLYVFGMAQPRYGAGPLITAGAEFLAAAVKAQAETPVPLGDVLARIGGGPPKTLLVDPFEAIRRAKRGQRLAPWLPWLARWVPGVHA